MSTIIDLSVPVKDHFRWPVIRELKKDFAQGDPFQVSWVGWTVHGFTHIDAPRHMFRDGGTTSDMKLDQIIGAASVVDLGNILPETEITEEMVSAFDGRIEAKDIVLIKTNWDLKRSIENPTFWTDAPFMSRGAADYLLSKNIKAVGFDFPQDYPIRNLLHGKEDPISEYVTHDVLLRNDVLLIEYLCNMSDIQGNRCEVFALPIKIPKCDGAPARVVAIENH